MMKTIRKMMKLNGRVKRRARKRGSQKLSDDSSTLSDSDNPLYTTTTNEDYTLEGDLAPPVPGISKTSPIPTAMSRNSWPTVAASI